jgi:hypothetical protein
LVATETKLRRHKKNPKWTYSTSLRDFFIYHSKCGTNPQRGQAGILVGIHKAFAERENITTVLIEPELHGYVFPITIQRPLSQPLLIIGVYMPQTILEQAYMQNKIISLIQEYKEHRYVVLGDFNAALFPTDRDNPAAWNLTDKQHAHFTRRANLFPLDASPSTLHRPYTYRRESTTGERCYKSRIDDILIGPVPPALDTTTFRVINTEGKLTDHNGIAATLPFSELGQLPPIAAPPIPDDPKTVRLVSPLTNKVGLTAAATEQLGPQTQQLHAELRNALTQDAHPHWTRLEQQDACNPHPLTHVLGKPAKTFVNQMGEQISELFQGLHAIALTVCKTKRVHNSRSRHRNRTLKKKRQKLVKTRNIISTLRMGGQPDFPDAEVASALQQLQNTIPGSEGMPQYELVMHEDATAFMQTLKSSC